ncbi:ABC-2 transporter permease [Anaerovorax odorimutans]|uniref:ABC-2 transporter permease n=1 Tax=Anaerovorax odorimutans TaxID=109327 RepID=A0ABT1RSN5_9FIRM|nr:ABC-2 transporter permease [Anaerovorax odorimutans]MCQ4638187.1 ABC-2 transporter permease [Anaerovorax odorimutans]
MKAMLLKDLYTLKESKMFIMIILFVAVIMAFWGGDSSSSFIVSYITVIAAVLVVNTIAYDETDNGYAFLFTLPASRRAYIRAKYIFGFITGFVGWLAAVILAVLIGNKSGNLTVEMQQIMFGTALASFLLLQAVMIPVQIKFGGQRGKIAILVLIAAGIGGGVLLADHVDMTKVMDFLGNMGMTEIGILAAAIVLIALGISYKCSIGIITRKEF